MYAFVQVYPVDHRFDKIVGITNNKALVDRVRELVESNEAFKRSFDRLDSQVIHDLTYHEICLVQEINELIGASIDWVDELIIQEIKSLDHME